MSGQNKAFIFIGDEDPSGDRPEEDSFTIDVEGSRTEGGQSRAAFLPYYEPKSISELLAVQNLQELLGKGFVFIQNRKDSSTHLLNRLKPALRQYDYNEVNVDGSKNGFLDGLRGNGSTRWLDSLLTRGRKTASARNGVFLIHAANELTTRRVCECYARTKTSQFGFWLRGYLWELDPYLISLFDALFVFDMSMREYEILRSAIDLSAATIRDLKAQKAGTDPPNVLFFLNHERSPDGPLLAKNPVVIQL